MKRIITVAALALAGCTTGQAEFASLPGEGKLSQATLIRAQGYCKMRANDTINRMVMQYGAEATLIAGQGEIIEDTKACFASQGVVVKGWRQKDGSLTSSPYANSAKIEAGGKFPPKPKKG